jgi:putative membrane protein
VMVVARRSDAYHDVALHWAVLAMLLVLALLAIWPGIATEPYAALIDPWVQPSPKLLFTAALILLTLTFLLMRLLLAWRAPRMALTPAATKSRRVRRQAITLFKAAAEKRTAAATGVLLYLSLEERRAELVADAAIHSKVAPDVWGEAMADLIEAVKDGRPADGMVQAVARVGEVLAEHFPRRGGDVNELPDRLIEI